MSRLKPGISHNGNSDRGCLRCHLAIIKSQKQIITQLIYQYFVLSTYKYKQYFTKKILIFKVRFIYIQLRF